MFKESAFMNVVLNVVAGSFVVCGCSLVDPHLTEGQQPRVVGPQASEVPALEGSLPSPPQLPGFFLRTQSTVRCVTPVAICFVPGVARPGTPCWCQTPYGPVGGYVG